MTTLSKMPLIHRPSTMTSNALSRQREQGRAGRVNRRAAVLVRRNREIRVAPAGDRSARFGRPSSSHEIFARILWTSEPTVRACARAKNDAALIVVGLACDGTNGIATGRGSPITKGIGSPPPPERRSGGG